MEQNYTRRLSLEEDFMNYSSDDLLYGALQYLATYHPELEMLYLTKKNITKSKKELYNLCGLNAKSLKRHLDKLEEKGLIKTKTIYIGNDKTEYECYTFPYKYDGKYQIVNNEMLWYIVSTRNQQAVRVYTMLLDWYIWKHDDGEEFIFTNKDILKKLGYSTDNKLASSVVSNILESFKREGVINYEEYYELRIDNSGREIPTPKKRLVFVAKSKSELK